MPDRRRRKATSDGAARDDAALAKTAVDAALTRAESETQDAPDEDVSDTAPAPSERAEETAMKTTPTVTPESTRRREPRLPARIRVDYRSDETFLYAYTSNVSSFGIFLRTNFPPDPGTRLWLVFDAQDGGAALEIEGEVAWVNPLRVDTEDSHPGMGVRFLDVVPEIRQRLIELVRRIAYLANGGGLGQA